MHLGSWKGLSFRQLFSQLEVDNGNSWREKYLSFTVLERVVVVLWVSSVSALSLVSIAGYVGAE